jgi:Glycine zipper 2TM domain
MRKILIYIAATTILTGCATDNSYDRSSQNWRNYDYNRPDPSYGGYDADRYHRADSRRYRERRLSQKDRIYRGQDGRYYCRRSDGSTGLIVGAIAGGVLGNIIAPGRSETLGTILGAIAGGLAGREVDRNNVRCK